VIILDTGVVLAAADADDRHHASAVALLNGLSGDELVLPAPVIAESAWMIESRLDPATEAAFIESVALGEFTVADLGSEDYERCAELILTYAVLGLGVVDASVVAVAERLDITTVATLNHRDFRVVRPAHTAAFVLRP
jgi:predicted nucleic acid-binding protein